MRIASATYTRKNLYGQVARQETLEREAFIFAAKAMGKKKKEREKGRKKGNTTGYDVARILGSRLC